MNRFVRLPALLVSTLSFACVVDVDVDEQVEGRVKLEVDLSGECEGAGEIMGEGGTTRYQKTLEEDGAVCRIELVWNGVLVDIPSLRKDIEEQVDIDDVTVTSVDIEVVTAALEDANGRSVTPPRVPYWAATLEAAEQQLLDLVRTEITRLDEHVIELDVGDAMARAADRALHQNEAIPASATSTLRIDAADLPSLQSAAGPVGIELELVTTIGAKAEVRPLRR